MGGISPLSPFIGEPHRGATRRGRGERFDGLALCHPRRSLRWPRYLRQIRRRVLRHWRWTRRGARARVTSRNGAQASGLCDERAWSPAWRGLPHLWPLDCRLSRPAVRRAFHPLPLPQSIILSRLGLDVEPCHRSRALDARTAWLVLF